MATTSSTGVACRHIIYKWQKEQQAAAPGFHPRGTYNLALFICKCLSRHGIELQGRSPCSRHASCQQRQLHCLPWAPAPCCCSTAPQLLPCCFGLLVGGVRRIRVCVTDIKCSWLLGCWVVGLSIRRKTFCNLLTDI